MQEYIEMFKALSDETRVRMMHLLCSAKTALCVCEFVDSLEEPQYNISKHLKILKSCGLIQSHKEGRWVYYELNGEQDAFKGIIFKAILVLPPGRLKKDLQEFNKRLSLRVRGKCLRGIKKKRFMGTGGFSGSKRKKVK